MNFIERMRYWLLVRLVPKRRISTSRCANRITWQYRLGDYGEVTIIVRHLGMPDGYSREELLEMQETVWKHEARMGWTVPSGYRESARPVPVEERNDCGLYPCSAHIDER